MKKTALVLPLCLFGASPVVSTSLNYGVSLGVNGQKACLPTSRAACDVVDTALTDCQRALMRVIRAEEAYRSKHGSYRLTVQEPNRVRLISVPTLLQELGVAVDTTNHYEQDSVRVVAYHPDDTSRVEDDSTLCVTFLHAGSIIGIATATYVLRSNSVQFEAHVLPPFRSKVVPLK